MLHINGSAIIQSLRQAPEPLQAILKTTAKQQKLLILNNMELETAHKLYEEYKGTYEERYAENCVNEEKFFLNSLEVVHLPPFNDTSYEVIVYAIKEGKVIDFNLRDAIRLFGNSL